MNKTECAPILYIKIISYIRMIGKLFIFLILQTKQDKIEKLFSNYRRTIFPVF